MAQEVELQVVYLDTETLILLYEGRAERLSKAATRAIEEWQPIVSPAAIFELEVLHEKGRRAHGAKSLIDALVSEIGLQICSLPFRTIIEHALAESWTREPWDRLIVANAKAAEAPLITPDENILKHYSRAIW